MQEEVNINISIGSFLMGACYTLAGMLMEVAENSIIYLAL